MTNEKKKDLRGNIKLPAQLHKELSHYGIDEELSLAQVVERAWYALQGRLAAPVELTEALACLMHSTGRDAADHQKLVTSILKRYAKDADAKTGGRGNNGKAQARRDLTSRTG